VGRGIQDVFAYLLALVFLLVRPHGLFGREVIERV
jgi:branched-chain amino acid transport system permease protein